MSRSLLPVLILLTILSSFINLCKQQFVSWFRCDADMAALSHQHPPVVGRYAGAVNRPISALAVMDYCAETPVSFSSVVYNTDLALFVCVHILLTPTLLQLLLQSQHWEASDD